MYSRVYIIYVRLYVWGCDLVPKGHDLHTDAELALVRSEENLRLSTDGVGLTPAV